MSYNVVAEGCLEKTMKLKGNRRGVAGVFWRALKRREAVGDLIAATIDEYKISKVCNACSSDPSARMSELKGCGCCIWVLDRF
ncbi:uncharacterized protein RHIMIDRAFT_296136 [Rhizopus microsporus ATCC 52813]|uniref:Uncharacterized protein n=1 Tax=Rhizopus microsporus ATCC 52813 TaxID=1340429 RepID=A0A2G4SEG6_RHIZD|nr:uncharacterized protein RHIMIDRAFT_296136 [Rhizopus microsporus ATCC 52813]PHZ07178.1 hypothetical protein RHIMIDRAFT_296136 [Rhizopus microsporus ATCC 52813]